jgi:hypothetical protein
MRKYKECSFNLKSIATTIFIFIALAFFYGCNSSSSGSGSTSPYSQSDLEGIWTTIWDESRYYFIDETGKLINVEPGAEETIHDFSGSLKVRNGTVTGTLYLDHSHSDDNTRHAHDINFSGPFTSTDEIEMDWDVPNVDNGTATWKRVPYTGNTAQATVTTQNALNLAIDTWFATDIGGKTTLYYLTGNPLNVDETYDGDCGGTAQLVGTIDGQSGFFDGSLTYDDFCDESYAYDGVAEFEGFTNLASAFPFFYLYNFFDITITVEEELLSLTGKKGFDFTQAPNLMFLSYVLMDEILDESYWINVDFYIAEIEDFFEIYSGGGRYYNSELGYFDLSIEQTVHINDGELWPASGSIILTGAEGSQGGNTKIRLTFISATEFSVDADTDGDGEYDDYNSGTQKWSEL